MKLVTFTAFTGLPLPGIRASGLMTWQPNEGTYGDWRVHVRGPSVLLVSPPGWKIGVPAAQRDGTDKRIYEIPRSHCYLGWDAGHGDKLDDIAKWSPPCEVCGIALSLDDYLLCPKCEKDKPAAVEPPAVGAVPEAELVAERGIADEIEQRVADVGVGGESAPEPESFDVPVPRGPADRFTDSPVGSAKGRRR